MNVKPGDLAMIVCLQEDDDQSLLGRVIRVVALGMHGKGYRGQTWSYEPPLFVHRLFGPYLGFSDECLRPIRDPGDDAKDESLTWLPAPEKVYITTKENA